MKQKLLAAASIAAVVVGGLTACSSGSASAEPTIKLWLPPLGTDAEFNEEQAWDDILAPFEKEHGLNVKVTIVSWTNYEEKFLTGI